MSQIDRTTFNPEQDNIPEEVFEFNQPTEKSTRSAVENEIELINKETMADIRRKITKSVTEKTQKTYEKNFNTWRDYDLLTCLIAIVGLLLAIVEYEYTFLQVTQAYSSDKL